MLSPRLSKKFESLGLWFFGLALPLLFFPPAEDAFRLTQLASLALASLCLALSPPSFKTTRLSLLGLAFFAIRLFSQAQGGFRLAWSCEQLLYAWIYFWAAQQGD